jgi:hypothetical protein
VRAQDLSLSLSLSQEDVKLGKADEADAGLDAVDVPLTHVAPAPPASLHCCDL